MSAAERDDPYRLPTNVKPTHYDLTIKTDLEGLTFVGLVKISIDIVAQTSTLVLNTSGLVLGRISLHSDVLGDEVSITASSSDKEQQRTTFTLSKDLHEDSKAELRISFSAELSGDVSGYFKSSWKHEGKTEYCALTQLAPTAARNVFPCWDEPSLKATFAINMVSRAGTTNLSNMPVSVSEDLEPGVNTPTDLAEMISSTHNEKWRITKFQTSPPMSTYLVAFANGVFEYLETSVVMPLSKKNVPLRIYATGDIIHQARFSLDVKASVLPLYEEIFEVEYPLPKLDTLVVPNFESGAMENWGLIIGQTYAFLFDPERGDLQAKKRVAGMTSHEVAHMWFGNITTMEWWTYIYLNEGFATLMEAVVIPDRRAEGPIIFPAWRVPSAFINDHLNSALELDSKLSSHPIEVNVSDANQIMQVFDKLSYSKGASILRMLSKYIGEEKFLKGVSIYLKKHLFGNTVTHDLWNGISEASGLNVTEMMENWVAKIGFPVLTVTEDDTGILVRQDRFLENGHAGEEDNETIWNIPLFVLTEKDGRGHLDATPVLQEREVHIDLDNSKPFKLNGGTAGAYRVLYTPQRLALIAAEAATVDSIFSLDDKMGLIQDTMALCRAGLAKVGSLLTLVDLWKNEEEYYVWKSIAESISGIISTWWEFPEILSKLNSFRRDLFSPLVKRLGYDFPKGESSDTTQLRVLAVGEAANANDEEVLKELLGRFKHFMNTGDNSKIPSDLERVIYTTAVKHGGRAEYDTVVKIYGNPKTPSENISAITAMGATLDPGLQQETLAFISTKAKDRDVLPFLTGLGLNFTTRRLLTKYTQEHYDALFARPLGNFVLGVLISKTIDFYSSMEDHAAFEAFFKEKDTSRYDRSLAQALDAVRARAAYVERATKDLDEWLSQRAYTADIQLSSRRAGCHVQ